MPAGEAIGDVTDAAKSAADDLGVDLEDVKGTGADGRILVNDVKSAAKG